MAFLPAPNCLRFVVVDWDLDRTAEAEETLDEEFPMAKLEQARQPLEVVVVQLLSSLAGQ